MKKGFLSIFMLVMVSFSIFAGTCIFTKTQDQMNPSKQYLNVGVMDDNSGDATMILNIGIGPANKGTLAISFTEKYQYYGSDGVRVMYKFDNGSVNNCVMLCSNGGFTVYVVSGYLRTFWNGILKKNRLYIRIFGTTGTQYNYSFDLKAVRKQLRKAGMTI